MKRDDATTRRRDALLALEEALRLIDLPIFSHSSPLFIFLEKKNRSDQIITISGRGNRESFDHVPRSRIIVFIMDQDQQLAQLFEYFVNYRDAVIV